MVPSSSQPSSSHRDPCSLLSSFLALHCDPVAFAQAHNLSATDLLDFAANPAVRAHLADLKRFIDQSLSLRTAQARIAALDTLESVARTADDAIERRRAAASILRYTVPIRHRATDRGGTEIGARPAHASEPISDHFSSQNPRPPESDDPFDDPPPPREPETTLGEPVPPLFAHAPIRFAPDPRLSADDLVHTVALALYTIDNPACAAAISAHLSADATIAGAPAPVSPRDIAALPTLRPRAPVVHHQHVRTAAAPDASTHTIVLMHARTPSTHYALDLARSDHGPHEGCWLIKGLSRTSDSG